MNSSIVFVCTDGLIMQFLRITHCLPSDTRAKSARMIVPESIIVCVHYICYENEAFFEFDIPFHVNGCY